MEEFMLPCLNKQLFGLDCMGCGAQRSLALVLRGEFLAAFKMFPAIYTILLLLGFLVMDLFIKLKGALSIKIALIIVNAIIIVGAYFYKLSFLFN